MSLIQNNYISEQIKNIKQSGVDDILLPESVNEVSPEALKPYVDKIRDALYILSKTHCWWVHHLRALEDTCISERSETNSTSEAY